MIGFIESWRVDDVGALHSIQQIQQGNAGGLQARRIGNDVELGDFAPLHDDGAYACDAIERRLEIVGGNLPQTGLRDGGRPAILRRKRIAEDGERRKRETGGGDARRGRQRLLNFGESGVNELECVEHVHIPIEEQTDVCRPTAGVAPNGCQAGHGVDCVFDRLGDGDLHLLDRHDAVINTNYDAGKISIGKNRDWHLRGCVQARQGQSDQEEDDRCRQAGEPEGFFRVTIHLSSPAP